MIYDKIGRKNYTNKNNGKNVETINKNFRIKNYTQYDFFNFLFIIKLMCAPKDDIRHLKKV